MRRLLLSFISAANLVRADFDIQHWEFRRTIEIKQPAPVSAMVIDASVYRASRAGLNDLRIIRNGVEVPYRLRTLPGQREELEFYPTSAQTTSFVSDIGFQGFAYNRVDLSIDPGMFWRNAEISTSGDGKMWTFAGQGAISRTAKREQLSIEFPEQWNRYIRITVFNGDDAPLVIRRISLSGTRRVVEFPTAAAGSYWLYSGNESAKQPSYDFARVTETSIEAPVVFLAGQELNPSYRAPSKPWTDRNPLILNIVLVVAVAVMGFITLRFLREVRAR